VLVHSEDKDITNISAKNMVQVQGTKKNYSPRQLVLGDFEYAHTQLINGPVLLLLYNSIPILVFVKLSKTDGGNNYILRIST
jgi:hypothetical protein